MDAVLAGISREEDTDSPPARIVKQIICDLTYPNTTIATEILQHRIYQHLRGGEWNIHELADRLGYEVGKALYQFYVNGACSDFQLGWECKAHPDDSPNTCKMCVVYSTRRVN